MTRKQKNEIKCLDYFVRKGIDYSRVQGIMGNDDLEIHEQKGARTPEESYFRITDSGIKGIVTTDKTRLLQLLDAKKWRLRTIAMWEEGVLDGSINYWTLFGGETVKEIMPEVVVEFVAKTMFQGANKDIINETYSKINTHWTRWRRLLFKLKELKWTIKRLLKY